MKRNEDFRNALGQPDEYFRQSVLNTLNELNRQAEQRRRPERKPVLRFACACAAVIILCAGIILSRRLFVLPAENQADPVNPVPSALVPLARPTTVETERATLVFSDAVADGSRILIPVEVRPKSDRCIVLTRDYTTDPVDYRETVWEYYNIRPEASDTSIRDWVKNRGYRETLAVQVNSPWDYTTATGPYYGAWHNEDIRLMEDGSLRMTVVGPAVSGSDTYELAWETCLWNMDDEEDPLRTDTLERGTVRIELSGTQASASAALPSADFPEADTEYATLTFLNAVREEDRITLTVQARPKQEHCVVWSDVQMRHTALEATRGFYGVFPDEPYQSLNGWLARRGYTETVFVEIFPAGAESGSDSSRTVKQCLIEADGSALMTVAVDAPSGTGTLTMEYTVMHMVNMADDGSHYGSEGQAVGSFRIVIPEDPAQPLTVMMPADWHSAETELAALNVREAVTDGYGVFLDVEVTPRHEHALVLSSAVADPSSAPVEWAGRTPDYPGQTVLAWARDHGYGEVIRVFFSNPFDPFSAGILPAPAFDSVRDNHAEYREDGSAVIRVTGTALPDTDRYEAGFVLQLWDMRSGHEKEIIKNSQIIGSMPVRVTVSTEENEVLAEYRSVSGPDGQEPSTTLTLVRTPRSEYCEIRTLDVPYSEDALARVYSDALDSAPLDFSPSDSGEPGVTIRYNAREDDGTFVYRRACRCRGTLPDMLSLFWSSDASGQAAAGVTIRDRVYKLERVR